MIRPLRRAHRWTFVALALVLPALLVSARMSRRTARTQSIDPELLPGSGNEYADGLVYWTAKGGDTGASEGALPPDAELVGTVRSGAWDREPPADKMRVVYSPAHTRVVGGGALP